MLEGKTPATLRNVFAALIAGLFAWIGVKRATSPDVVTGSATLDKSGTAAKVDSVLLADIQRANAAKPGAGG
jgi:N-acetylmuramic acid 6-phosphate (MurNAc-6-P) etherase